jgi:L-alanine-DL-glutamate epimerase-like enolase superfamily enzyme
MVRRAWSITDLEVFSVDIAMREAFGIATGSKSVARNCFVRLTLADGTVGWGEAAPFEAVNGEQREHVTAALARVSSALLGFDLAAWRTLGPWLAHRVIDCPSARCAIETAALDSITRSMGVSLSTLFGGAQTELECDLTITTGTAQAARASALSIMREGYKTIKLKVGGSTLATDLARLSAVIEGAPGCSLVLDGNGALTVEEALAMTALCRERDCRLVVFEQPCDRADLDAAAEVFVRSGVRVCADESVSTVADVIKLAHRRAAQAINLKIMKSGILEAYAMAITARSLGLELMIGGMVESTLAMSASAHLAAGVGGFLVVDLDTPLWLIDEPIDGGLRRSGPQLSISHTHEGHGASLRASVYMKL